MEKKGTEGALLADLLRTILRDLGLSEPSSLSRLIDRYISRYRAQAELQYNKTGKKPKVINRSHVEGDIITDNLTWKRFLKAIFNVLNVREMKIHITLTHATGARTEHEYTIKNRGTTVEDSGQSPESIPPESSDSKNGNGGNT